MSCYNIILSFFLSFLVLTSLYLLIVGVEDYCCSWSRSLTNTLGIAHLDEESARRRGPYPHNTQYSQDIDIHAPRRDSKTQFQRAGADPGLRPRGRWDRQEHYLKKLTKRKVCEYYVRYRKCVTIRNCTTFPGKYCLREASC